MSERIALGLLGMAFAFAVAAATADEVAPARVPGAPFSVAASLEETSETLTVLTVSFAVPPGHYLYADRIRVEAPKGVTLTPKQIPAPKTEFDSFSHALRQEYTHDVTLSYLVTGLAGNSLSLAVHYQGCGPTVCFLPATREIEATFRAAPGRAVRAGAATGEGESSVVFSPESQGPERAAEGTSAQALPAARSTPGANANEEWRALAKGFHVVGQITGYVPAREFVSFLEKSRAGKAVPYDRLVGLFEKGSWVFAILLILLGGLALNLTPCVLPLIPINLMIIGAGARSASRARGFLLGGAYGAGMALTYGLLGAVAALTGAAFGSLNASPWFNFSIAVLFVVLALALFDVIAIDLSRYQPKAADALSRDGAVRDRAARGAASRLLRGGSAAFLMGAVAALLAGACVAPVVISVLIIAGNLYRAGHAVGLVLPFVLGVGMALPWPFAGAGLSVLPKPGKWMTRVKYAFAAFVLLFAVYYAREGYSLARDRLRGGEAAQVAAAQARRVDQEGWLRSLPEALRQAKREGKPLFIDFWAGWCKSCLTMDRTTFRDPAVKKALESFVKLKYRADDPTESPTKEVLERFTVLGLPTYVILRP